MTQLGKNRGGGVSRAKKESLTTQSCVALDDVTHVTSSRDVFANQNRKQRMHTEKHPVPPPLSCTIEVVSIQSPKATRKETPTYNKMGSCPHVIITTARLAHSLFFSCMSFCPAYRQKRTHFLLRTANTHSNHAL